jgi:putative SOS response-associated peptidase YedK
MIFIGIVLCGRYYKQNINMCSRYFLDADGHVIAYTFQVPVHDRIRKRFNIAPTQQVPVIRPARGPEGPGVQSTPGVREVVMMRWGLVPSWAKDLAIGNNLINARCETVDEKPAFRSAFKSRRCVIPASGFFEWTGEPKARVPHAITVEGRPLLPFAGLWESWNDAAGTPIETCTIITTAANRFMTGLHDRMPAILDPADIDTWMSGCAEDASKLIKPYADEPMREREVTRALNSSTFEADDALTRDPAAYEPPQLPRRTRSARDDSGQQSLF